MGGRFLHLVQCSCGKRDWTRMSSWEWKAAHKRYCGQFEEESYRLAEDRTERDMADHYAEQEALAEAVDSGFYGGDAA